MPVVFTCPLGSTMESCNPYVHSVSDQGVLSITFPTGIYAINETLFPILSNSLLISLETSSKNVSISSWNVISQTAPLQIGVQLSINNSLYVSTSKTYDKVSVKFINTTLIISDI